jgi:hypothetical protein
MTDTLVDTSDSGVYPSTLPKPHHDRKPERSINSKKTAKMLKIGGGLSTRYYFLRAQRVALFCQLGATYGQSSYYADADGPNKAGSGSPQRANTFQTNAGLGVHYRLGNRWSIEASGERILTNSTWSTLDASPWRANIGLNFRIK